ncbi:MAG TPA: hypothetical protein VEG60_06580, partial [Candidatus Binatia bacterium]|nr:hypothetical protein [Candidatus Binatia bacterium]
DRMDENLNVVSRLYYSASTTLCCTHSLSEDGAAALGNLPVSYKSIRKPRHQSLPKRDQWRSTVVARSRRRLPSAPKRAGRAGPGHG